MKHVVVIDRGEWGEALSTGVAAVGGPVAVGCGLEAECSGDNNGRSEDDASQRTTLSLFNDAGPVREAVPDW